MGIVSLELYATMTATILKKEEGQPWFRQASL
jgi:hypothetical protein